RHGSAGSDTRRSHLMTLRFGWRIPVTRGALLLMEAMWCYALTAFLVAGAGHGGKPSFIAALLVVSIPFLISRFLQQTDLSLGILRAWGALLSILLFYAIIRIDFFGDWRLWDFGWADNLFAHTHDFLLGHNEWLV